MQHNIDQANHNVDFHQCIESNFGSRFCDWKITVLFYTAIHYLRALAAKRGIDIGATHVEIESNINPTKNGTRKMAITRNAWNEYKSLLEYSKTARYSGITDLETFQTLKEADHGFCIKHLDNFKKYIEGQGMVLDRVDSNIE